ncbi:MAG: hypothetical protein KF824_04065 [Fimbriimonadaceae bacterium]|nr:MAG: hypothetical protein KF824_04065 [Fimbriimonadaceae bacterium]
MDGQITPKTLQLHRIKSDNKSIEATASNLPITTGTKTYQIDEEGNLVIRDSEQIRRAQIMVSASILISVLGTLIFRSVFIEPPFSIYTLAHPYLLSSCLFFMLALKELRPPIKVTNNCFVIWQQKDKYPPDKITAVKVKKEMWHDYCVIIESDLEKRKVSGTLYIEQAEQVQKLIQGFLDQNKAVNE